MCISRVPSNKSVRNSHTRIATSVRKDEEGKEKATRDDSLPVKDSKDSLALGSVSYGVLSYVPVVMQTLRGWVKIVCVYVFFSALLRMLKRRKFINADASPGLQIV